ncbi:uncharacterized protein [Littorina saxatilis]|uniref:Uncharacterized protein n=1 Tax=Littorina saxatilis TaxID=31220 RepID=A0AAN9B305_9CAEN
MGDKADHLEEKFFNLLNNPGALAGVVVGLIILLAIFVFLAVALFRKRKPMTREIVITAEEGKAVGGKGDKKKLMGEDEEEDEREGVGRGPIWLGGQRSSPWLDGQPFFTVSLTGDPKNSKI